MVYAKVDGVASSRPLPVHRDFIAGYNLDPLAEALTKIDRIDRDAQMMNMLRSVSGRSQCDPG